MGNNTNNQPFDLVSESTVTQIKSKNYQSDKSIQSFEEYTSKQEENANDTEVKEQTHGLEKKRKILEVENNIKFFKSQLLSYLEFYEDLTGEKFNSETVSNVNDVKKKCTDCLDHIEKKQILTLKYTERINGLNNKVDELEEEVEVLKKEVYIDPLTQINNRKRFFQYYDSAISEAEEVVGKKFTLAIIDVDNFKYFNDTYGHPAGDKVLQLLTSIITKQIGTLNNSTAICRIGGEEFAVISRKSPNEIYKILDETLKYLSKNILNIDNVPKEYRLTFSGGISTYISSMKGSKMALLEDADRTMYEAKTSGKGQIQISNNK